VEVVDDGDARSRHSMHEWISGASQRLLALPPFRFLVDEQLGSLNVSRRKMGRQSA
jgi:hypothetical protein